MPMDAEVFPALVLGSLQRHLGKLRQTTMEFAAAPPEALTWTQSRPLHDAVELLLQVGWLAPECCGSGRQSFRLSQA